jgi:hypothetical protein
VVVGAGELRIASAEGGLAQALIVDQPAEAPEQVEEDAPVYGVGAFDERGGQERIGAALGVERQG